MNSTTIKNASPLAVLRNNSDIRKIWLAQIVSETGDWLTRIAVTAHVANNTERPALAIATIMALMIAPYFFVSPFAGVLADRLPRRSIILWVDAIAAVTVLGYLVTFNLPQSNLSLVLTGVIVVIHLGLAGLFEAARTSLIAAVARPEELASANALTQTTWSVCLALGSALGGFLVLKFGRDTAVLVDSCTFVLGVAIIYTIRGGRTAALAGSRHDSGSFREGIEYLRSHPTTGAMVLPKLALGFVGMNDLTFAILGPREFHTTSEESLSLYFLCIGAGTLVGPFLGNLFAKGDPRKMRAGIAAAFLCEAVIFSGTLVSHSLLLTCIFAGLATAGGSVVWTFSCTLLQRATPDRVTGRAMALDIGLLTATAGISQLVAGFLVDYCHFTPRHLFIVTTATYASGGVLWIFILNKFRGQVWDGDLGRPAN